MFDDLRAAFSEALDNFNKELKRDQVPESVDRLLAGMKNEIVDEKAQVAGLEHQLETALSQAARQKELAETCRRREEMAGGIGDQDTASVAAQYAVKHEGHHALLEKKAEAIREEMGFRRKTVEEMVARFTEARERKDTLAATTGRAGARQSLADADDLFGELDRMAEKIDGERAKGEAAEAFDNLDLETDSEYHVDLEEPPRQELDVDAALAELKRRMEKD